MHDPCDYQTHRQRAAQHTQQVEADAGILVNWLSPNPSTY